MMVRSFVVMTALACASTAAAQPILDDPDATWTLLVENDSFTREDAHEELCVLPRSRCLDLSRVTSGTPCPEMAPAALWDTLEWYEALAVWLLSERRRGEAQSAARCGAAFFCAVYFGLRPRPRLFSSSETNIVQGIEVSGLAAASF